MKNPFKLHNTFNKADKAIMNAIKKTNSLLYGQKSVKKQIGPFTSQTTDYDIHAKKPKQFVKKLEKQFDRRSGGNNFYSKPTLFGGGHKLMYVGRDGQKGTNDDWNLVDATPMPKPMPKTIIVDGMRMTTLSQEAKARKTALKDKTQEFRWEKDNDRLKDIQRFKKWKNGGII